MASTVEQGVGAEGQRRAPQTSKVGGVARSRFTHSPTGDFRAAGAGRDCTRLEEGGGFGRKDTPR